MYELELQSIRDKRVLVLGDVFLDEYLYGDCHRISPEAPVPILVLDDTKTKTTLGGAANVAHNVATLGGIPTLIGMHGADPAHKTLDFLTEKAGIRYRGCFHAGPTIRKTRVISQRQQLFRMDHEIIQPCSKLDADIVLKKFKTELKNTDIVVLSDYAKGFFRDAEMVERICELAHEAGKLVIIDPKPVNALFYTYADWITPNQDEADQMKHGYSAQYNMLITRGREGMSFCPANGGETFRIKSHAQEVFDVSGAGDTVVAALALMLASNAKNRLAIKFANFAAGIAVSKLGTYAVTVKDVCEKL